MGKKKKNQFIADEQVVIGEELSFAAREAYKLLRTNITLSLPDSGKCRVIGITSSVVSEGKSTTSMNLAYSLAESGRRVLLLEGDMRRPNVADHLGLKRSPGLSNLLTGMCTMAEASQQSDLQKNLCVVCAGDVPPNPSELLASNRMANCIKSFSEHFDYIVLDLPPIMAVTDAVVSARLVDGLVLVVRSGYCRKPVLREALRQLKFADVKLLGFVTTFNDIKTKRYSKYSGYGYGYGYGAASDQGS